eukprot:COSAG02_NODE_46134_length_351_cov_1.011905_1_plen_62_part_01
MVEFTGFTGTVRTTTPLAMVPIPGSTPIHPMIFTIGRTTGMPTPIVGRWVSDNIYSLPEIGM